jgi:hypothetical protein
MIQNLPKGVTKTTTARGLVKYTDVISELNSDPDGAIAVEWKNSFEMVLIKPEKYERLLNAARESEIAKIDKLVEEGIAEYNRGETIPLDDAWFTAFRERIELERKKNAGRNDKTI